MRALLVNDAALVTQVAQAIVPLPVIVPPVIGPVVATEVTVPDPPGVAHAPSPRRQMPDNKIIFSMVGVGKVVKPNRQILKDIYLSFFYGAKIGVLGLNGAGKSTLLRIIAGEDKDFIGEITAQKGITFGSPAAGTVNGFVQNRPGDC